LNVWSGYDFAARNDLNKTCAPKVAKTIKGGKNN
jgi:hypothetical protein